MRQSGGSLWIEGTVQNAKGKVQEGVSRVTGDARTHADGLANQAVGTAQDLYRHAPIPRASKLLT